jgi:hypothetical protein
MARPPLSDIAYARFAELYADGLPVRSEDDFEAAVRAAGLEFDEVDDAWLRSLNVRWVYHQSDEPFADEQVNREYRRIVSS